MEHDDGDILEVLKFELKFLEDGGYGRSQRTPWRPPYIFEDSPSCPKFCDPSRATPCDECRLMHFVPENMRDQQVPCRFIPINKDGHTIDDFYLTSTQVEMEEAPGRRTVAFSDHSHRAGTSSNQPVTAVRIGNQIENTRPVTVKSHEAAPPLCGLLSPNISPHGQRSMGSGRKTNRSWFAFTKPVRTQYLSPLFLIPEPQYPRGSDERLARICFADYNREIPLVFDYTDEQSIVHEILGGGRLSKLAEHNEGEVAVIISDQYPAQGLATELLKQLIQIAKNEGLNRLQGEVLRDKITMQTVMRKLGFRLRMLQDPATVHAVFEL